MALPNTEQLALDIVEWTLPFVCIEAKSTVGSGTLDLIEWTLPFAVNPVSSGGGGGGSLTAYVLVSGVWKTVDSAKVLVNGTWKDVDSFNTNVSGTWKS
tara:strand:+ start:17826 stop:18122 length:297 start_codon:yes stop_codon:yes gene_type:complete